MTEIKTDAGDLLAMNNEQLHRVAAVIDAARAHVYDPEVELPPDWDVPLTPTFAALLDAVRALDATGIPNFNESN